MGGFRLCWAKLILILALAGLTYAASPADVTWVRDYRANETASSTDTTEPGNITLITLNVTSQTGRWAGYFGNLTGSLVLSDDTYEFFRWDWDITAESVICAGTNTQYNWTTLYEADVWTVDTAWEFSGGSDLAIYTFNATQGLLSLTIGGTSLTDMNSSDTGGPDTGDADEFLTAVVNDEGETNTEKNNFLFCTETNMSGTNNAYNGETADFELIVPANETPGATETYYFFVELK